MQTFYYPLLKYFMLIFLCPGVARTKVTYLPNGAVVAVFPDNLTVAMETGGYSVVEREHQIHYKRKIVVPDHITHLLEWRFYLRRKRRVRQGRLDQTVGRNFRVERVHRGPDSVDAGIKEKSLLVRVSRCFPCSALVSIIGVALPSVIT